MVCVCLVYNRDNGLLNGSACKRKTWCYLYFNFISCFASMLYVCLLQSCSNKKFIHIHNIKIWIFTIFLLVWCAVPQPSGKVFATLAQSKNCSDSFLYNMPFLWLYQLPNHLQYAWYEFEWHNRTKWFLDTDYHFSIHHIFPSKHFLYAIAVCKRQPTITLAEHKYKIYCILASILLCLFLLCNLCTILFGNHTTNRWFCIGRFV